MNGSSQMENIQYFSSKTLIVYNVMCRDLAIKPNSTPWAKSVRHLLQSIGFNNVWINQVFRNVNLFIHILKERLNDIFIHIWNSELI